MEYLKNEFNHQDPYKSESVILTSGNEVIFTSTDKNFYNFYKADGKLLWKNTSSHYPSYKVIVNSDYSIDFITTKYLTAGCFDKSNNYQCDKLQITEEAAGKTYYQFKNHEMKQNSGKYYVVPYSDILQFDSTTNSIKNLQLPKVQYLDTESYIDWYAVEPKAQVINSNQANFYSIFTILALSVADVFDIYKIEVSSQEEVNLAGDLNLTYNNPKTDILPTVSVINNSNASKIVTYYPIDNIFPKNAVLKLTTAPFQATIVFTFYGKDGSVYRRAIKKQQTTYPNNLYYLGALPISAYKLS